MIAVKKTPQPAVVQNRASLNIVKLMQRLHASLDSQAIIKILVREIKTHLPVDGLVYVPPDHTVVKYGHRSRIQIKFRLVHRGDCLGELVIYRLQPFIRTERALLQHIIATSILPLKNSWIYRQALTNSLKDPLTRLPNRQAFDQQLQREMLLAGRHLTPLAMLLIDLDHFKTINDNHGHATGDAVLLRAAKIMAACGRKSDMLFRIGGDEFVILLSNTSILGATQSAERLRQSIEQHTFHHRFKPIQLTLSIGVGAWMRGDRPRSFFQRTDAALYQAKNRGKNRVVVIENVFSS